MICNNCGASFAGDICPYCQTDYSQHQPIPQQTIIINNNQTIYSSYATETTTTLKPAISSKSKVVALLLCILFGILGAHLFYVGKKGLGIVYIFTAGLFCIGWIYDIVKLCRGTFSDVHGLPLV